MTPTHVLITGAAHGIGFETALGYARRGARLSLVDRDGDALRAAARAIEDRSGVSADTDTADLRDPDAALVSRNPLGVSGTAADIARAVMWISGPDARWITGSVLQVDGGSSTGSHTLPLSWDSVVTDD